MADLEKVIKGLKQFKADFKPFCGNGSDWARVDDAINLLKEQEPRVMTLEEVHEMAWDYCYLEEEVIKDKVLQIFTGKYRIKCITWPSIASCVLGFGDDAYGKRWRCWTSRPTDEQRGATPWN